MFHEPLMILLAMTAAIDANAAATRGQVMLLGTHHLANNNRDLVNLPIENILTDKRQKEMDRLINGLAEWRPTRIAVEWPRVDQAGLDKRYQDYLDGRLKLTANERDQIAFQLAKKLHLRRVEAVDWNDAAPGDSSAYDFMSWAKQNGQGGEFTRFVKDGQDEANRMALTMRGSTISEWYRALNDPEERLKMHRPYFTIASFGTNDASPGAAWVGGWYARNLRIFNNLREHVHPGERLFVLYGAGHTYLLSRFIADSNAADSVDARKFIPRR